MVKIQLSNFCGLLNTDHYQDSSTFGIMVDFQYLLPKLKSEILSNKFEIKDNKNDYLDLVINEIENCQYDNKTGLKDIDKWLKKFNITLEKILSRNIIGNGIYKYIEPNYDYYPEMSKERDLLNSIQEDFLQFFCKYYADEIINFCNSQKENQINDNSKLPKPYKEEYLNLFCKSISNERELNETSFMQLYENGLTHYTPYLESEVLENLTLIDNDKKKDYFNYVIDKITRTPYFNTDKNILDNWVTKYKVNLSDFPKFNNKTLNDALSVYSGNDYMSYDEKENFWDIQLKAYCYASMIEAHKMIDFIEVEKNKIMNISKATGKQIKWSGKPSQFGFIMGTLADLDYIEAPKNHNGNINYRQFAKLLLEVYNVKTTQDTLEKYVNIESDKGQEAARKFKENNFNIPHKSIVS